MRLAKRLKTARWGLGAVVLGLGMMLASCAPGGGGAGAEGAASGAAAVPQKVFRWKLITTWPKNFPGLGLGPENLARMLREMSNGRLDITVYGAGELVGAFEVFDSVSSGQAEMGHGAAYYWTGKMPASAFFATVPFGLNAQELNGWLHYGGGLELWRELYKPFGVVPFACGNSGTQMGGWFNKEINSVADLKGVKMRMPGLAGEVFNRAGGTAVTMPGSEMYTNLQTGAIDATEWVGPYNDLALGLHSIAKYYYYPGWHEAGPTLELIVNEEAWLSLPKDLQTMVTAASRAVNQDMLDEFTARNNRALQSLLNEHGVELRRFPDDVLQKFRDLSEEVLAEQASGDELAKRIHDSYLTFRDEVANYHAISEQAYYEVRAKTARKKQ